MSSPPASPAASLSLPDDPAEKQGLLLELHQLERDGVALTRHFTLDDHTSDMRFELNRIRSNLDTANSVSMMMDGLQLGMKGVEMANSRWGPVLKLDGWSNVVDRDRERYQRVLTKLHKKHWRRGAMMTPEAELVMLLGGSAFLHHFQHKMGANPENNSGGIFGGLGNIMSMFSGGGGGGAPPPPPPPTAPGSFTQRPPMRRPNAAPAPDPAPAPAPAPAPSPIPDMNELRQAHLRQQSAFVVMSSAQTTPHHTTHGPQIEVLN